MATRALLFDVDGTLWDSFPWYADVLAGLSGQARTTVLEQLRAGASIVTLAKQCGVTDGRFRTACRQCAAELRLYEAVRETLAELESRGTPCGIVTSLPERIVVPLLEQLGLASHFPVVVHAGTVRPGKPHPAPLQAAMKRMGITDAGSTFYIGDSGKDALAAARAGMPFALAAYGYGVAFRSNGAVMLREFREVLQL